MYADPESRSNQVPNALIAHNIQSGDFVCQGVGNRPELAPAAERSSLRFVPTGAAPLQRRFESRFASP